MSEEINKIEVVVAEDSSIQAKILRKRLLEAGYEVRIGANGALALELIRERPPQIIISDIEMPEMNGFELCRAVKSDAALKQIPLILLSTLSSPEDIIQGLHAGADNYVTKPYEAAYLLGRVKSLLDTPITDEEHDDGPALDVSLSGKRYQVRSGRQQVLNLLISTFENAVEKNNELIRVNQELTLAKDQLTKWNADLKDLNAKLETANTRMSHDLDAAAKVQQSLLPTTDLDSDQLRGFWKYIPCDELAGDFLNFFPLDDQHHAFFVVDVSGHGVASSLLSVTIARLLTPQATSSSLLVRQAGDQLQIVPPGEVAAELNRRFPMEEQGGLYFTLLYGILNTVTGEFRYTSAGHDPPVHVPHGESPRLLPSDGFPIGWMDDIDFDEEVVTLSPGDRIFLYSDGVPEAMDKELNEFGEDRMVAVIAEGQSQPLCDGAAKLCDSVSEWCQEQGPKDDVSLLAFEIPN